MTPKKRTLEEFGAKREKVRVYLDGELVRVRWRLNGRRLTRSYPNTATNRAIAKAFAKGIVEERERPYIQAALTLRQLWDKFADAEFPHLRPRSRELYAEYWRRWEAMWGRDFPVEKTTLDMAHQFRKALGKLKLSTSTIGQTIRTAQMIYAWGERNEVISINKLRLYKFKIAKEERTESPPEFRGEDFKKFLAELDPTDGRYWRAFIALAICGAQGVRQNSALHLQWDDVTETITWRKEWDKLGREWSQPVRDLTRVALEVARIWREKLGYAGPWVIPSGSSKAKSPVYSAQSLWGTLRSAEGRAGVPHLKGRGAHGLRRMLMGDVTEATGDAALGLQAIGDTDFRMIPKYMKKRNERLEAAFRDLDANPETTGVK